MICIAALAAGGTFLHQERAAQSVMHVTAGNSVDMKSGYRRITYQGKEYTPKSFAASLKLNMDDYVEIKYLCVGDIQK